MENYLRARKLELAKPNDFLMVNRLYPAVEGEGSTVGQAKWFLRFQGCSVGCKWCDSKETWKFEGFQIAGFDAEQHSMFRLEDEDIPTLVKHLQVKHPSIRHISITGGEPLQQNLDLLEKLVGKLTQASFVLQLETSGQTQPTEQTAKILQMIVAGNGLISVDYKTPSSGLQPNFEMIEQCLKTSGYGKVTVQVKAVVSDDTDYKAVKEGYNRLMQDYPRAEYIITPCWEPGKEMKLGAEWFDMFICDTGWMSMPKVILQQHKTIYGTRNLDS